MIEPWFNLLGDKALPLVNDAANELLRYKYFNPDFQHGKGLYPGEEWCNPKIPHAKWHVEVAIALNDLTFLADEFSAIFQEYAEDNTNAGDHNYVAIPFPLILLVAVVCQQILH